MGLIKLVSGLLSILTIVSALPQTKVAAVDNVHDFSREGLAKLNAAMHKWVDDKKGANVVTLLAQKGRIVNHDAYGVMDVDAATKVPIQKDTIFRIMSMTKPVIGVAMMMMYEEGKWKPSDLVMKHIPEFGELKVKRADGTMVPQDTPMTMAQLCSHSAGFGTMLTVNSTTLSGIIPPLVQGQLAFQPGKDWRYGPGVEIQGYLIEKWAGKDLSDFLEERLFKPLDLQDTGFFIDAAKTDRVSKLHTTASGKLSVSPRIVATTKPARLSPSGGLMSTAEEYFKFCQMILNNGTFSGKQFLKPESVRIMHTNVLEPQVGVKLDGASGKGVGFGLDFAIIMDKIASNNNMPIGSFYWGGAYGTWFWIDPVNDVIFVGMIQNAGAKLSGDGSLRQISSKAVYDDLKQ